MKIKSLCLHIDYKMPLHKKGIVPIYADENVTHKRNKKVRTNKKTLLLKDEKIYKHIANLIVDALKEHYEHGIASTEPPTKKARYENENNENEKAKETYQYSNMYKGFRLLNQRIRQIEKRVKTCENEMSRKEKRMIRKAQQSSPKTLNKALSEAIKEARDEVNKPESK